jgi:hypothetical protein
MEVTEIDLPAWYKWVEGLAKKPPVPRYDRGPWNGRYLAPMVRRTSRVFIEPLAPPITDLDHEAYMGSIEHINRSYEATWPRPTITPDFASLDLHQCWTTWGRGEGFQFAALTHDRDKELGCAYLLPPADGDDPYETSLRIWVIESEVATDLDRHLLEEMLAWVDEEWDFNRVVHYIPRSYERGLGLAAAAGLREVNRKGPKSNYDYACFQWERQRG